ncbi:helix-turn-helix domain-containing protein [Micromonospora sp. NPDC023956]|uniref:helix-turn-helix domain-containing protein n=1 Tax=Micromonospora sp. NPDC023956 TaxID=3155722 RepID=UPI0033CD8EEA
MSLLRRVIGGVLRRLRVRQGRTLREVAEVAGVSVPYLSEVERGRKEASSEVLAAICRALGIRLSDLLEEARDDLRRVEPRTPVAPPRVPTGRVPTGRVPTGRVPAGRVPAGRRVLPAGRPTPAAGRPTAVTRPAPVTRPAAGGSTCPTNRLPDARLTTGRRPALTTRRRPGSPARVTRALRSGPGQPHVLLATGPSPRC